MSSKTTASAGTVPDAAIGVAIHNNGASTDDSRNKIHRFPSNLREIGRARDYIAPRTVALGPYYHGVAELQAMEDVKRAVVGYFFDTLGADGVSQEEAYTKIIPIARSVRGRYADAHALAGITEDQFASMMFIDGCFLVQLMYFHMIAGDTKACPMSSMIHPHLLSILRDILLLENQIPWPVVEFFMALRRLSMQQVVALLAQYLSSTAFSPPEEQPLVVADNVNERCEEPSHLLCLIRSNRAGRIKRHFRSGALRRLLRLSGTAPVKLSTSAAELAEIGVELVAGKAKATFSDMGVMKGPLFARLSLAPLCLEPEGLTACWLVNMAALEIYTETIWTGGCALNSYLGLISLLVTREEDVRELRAKGILEGSGDKSMLDWFDNLSPYLLVGHTYLETVVDLEEYKRKRCLWITVYSFLYRNARTIAAVLSIIGVLAGIFQTLLPLKQHQ